MSVMSWATPSMLPFGVSMRTCWPRVAQRSLYVCRSVGSAAAHWARRVSRWVATAARISFSLRVSPWSLNDVAFSTGSSAAVRLTFRPIPRAMRGCSGSLKSASARMPQIFFFCTRRSLGHLRLELLMTSVIATPAARGSSPRWGSCAASGVTSVDIARPVFGGASQVRSWRPRPCVWWWATRRVCGGKAGFWRMSAFVEPVVAISWIVSMLRSLVASTLTYGGVVFCRFTCIKGGYGGFCTRKQWDLCLCFLT